MTTDDEIAERPSLRITKLVITNYRCFRGQRVLPFADGASGPDAIVTFHGDNGTGKSTAIAALDEFFLGLTLCLTEGEATGEVTASWDVPMPVGDRTLTLSSRDRPAGTDGPTELEVWFQDPRLGAFRVRHIPSGKRVRLRAERRPSEPDDSEFKPVAMEDRDRLLTWIQTPLGPQSRALAILDERRRPSWMSRTEQGSLLHPALAKQLLSVRMDYDPEARQRWRAFVESLQRFPQFKNRIIDIQLDRTGAAPEMVVEDPGKTVLPLDKLSSGEQQLIVLYAGVVFARTPIVAIAEPELSLDEKNQKTFGALLAGLVKEGHVDQVILESHVPAFDGERVLRFSRSATGSTEVERVPSLGPEAIELRQRATAQGADQRWVTRDGYTQLPDAMCADLGVGSGANVWFLKNHERWGAWPEKELEQLFDPGNEAEKNDE